MKSIVSLGNDDGRDWSLGIGWRIREDKVGGNKM